MADKAGSALSRLLQRLPFKMPWQVRRMVMLLLHDGLSERERYKMSVRERREQDEPKKRPPRRNSFSTSASLFSLPLSFVPCWRFLDTLSSLPPFSTPQSSQKNATNTHGHPPPQKKKRNAPGHRRRLLPGVRLVHSPRHRVPQARPGFAADQGRRPARAPRAHLRHQVLAARREEGRAGRRGNQQEARRGVEVRRHGGRREIRCGSRVRGWEAAQVGEEGAPARLPEQWVHDVGRRFWKRDVSFFVKSELGFENFPFIFFLESVLSASLPLYSLSSHNASFPPFALY